MSLIQVARAHVTSDVTSQIRVARTELDIRIIVTTSLIRVARTHLTTDGANHVRVARAHMTMVNTTTAIGHAIDPARPATTVVLDGSLSTGDIDAVRWIQTVGPAVTITNSNALMASFLAPSAVAGTTVAFTLEVSDNGGSTWSTPDLVALDVIPQAEWRAVSGSWRGSRTLVARANVWKS